MSADVFGNTNVVVQGESNTGTTIRFECGSDWDDPVMAVLIPIADPVEELLPARIFVRTLAGEVVRSDACFAAWNEEHGAVLTFDRDFLQTTADVMVGAASGISIGVQVQSGGSDFQKADTFTSRGSTAAGSAFADNCLAE